MKKIEYRVIFKEHERDPELTKEIWMLDGKRHREHGPAVIYRNLSGETLTQLWFRYDELYREDGPSVEHNDGHSEEYTWSPVRADGPSRIVKIDGHVTQEHWLSPDNGKFHRVDGPAMISVDETTGVEYDKRWYQNGRLHCEDGPALIMRNRETGEITRQEYFFRGGKRAGPGLSAPKYTP